MTTTGTPLGSFPTGLSDSFHGIGMAPDGLSLYVTRRSATKVRHLDLTGAFLNEFNIVGVNYNLFMTVVPAPEPTSALLLLGSGAVFLLRRRRTAV